MIMTTLLRWLLRLLYGFRVFNPPPQHLPGPVLLLPNHVSWWDWLLVGVCLEDDWRFVTSSTTAETSWLHKRVMVNRRTFPVDMSSPYAVKRIAEYLQSGGRLVLFPEGRISATGSLMKLFDGTGFLMFKTRPKVITAYLRGAHRLPFSRNPDRKQWFPRISAHFSAVREPPQFERMSAAETRALLTDWLRTEMIRQQFNVEMEIGAATVPEAIAETARRDLGRVVLEDVTMKPLTFRRLFMGADLLAGEWQRVLPPGDGRVGVLLPNVNAMPVVLLSLWGAGKVPAVLNYTAGVGPLLACARLAELKQIITARSFLDRLNLDLRALRAAGLDLICLEDVRAYLSGLRKLAALARSLLPLRLRSVPAAEATAVILFTSGSEGAPKAVDLTHRNLLANVRQMLAVIDVHEADRLFNALPLFHCFGLNVGLFLPLVRGAYTFLYLSPLQYRVVPSAVYNLNCTVFFGTNTFLAGYARKAHPYDFRAVRYVFAGAEKLQEATVARWMRQFGLRVLEGYGLTECSPCLTVNVPMAPRYGSAGRFLPGIEYRLEPVEGLGEGGEPREARETPTAGTSDGACRPGGRVGRLLVRGPNVMRGYLNPEANARFQALGGWYDTGDIVRVDEAGYVFVLGRLKRFAKIGGEMVSLAAVEEALAGAFPHYGLRFSVAVITRPDEERGERLVAVTNEPKLSLGQIRGAIQASGLSNLCVPRTLKVLHDLPRLGSGKIDYRRLDGLIQPHG